MHIEHTTVTLSDTTSYVPIRCDKAQKIALKVSGTFVGTLSFTAQSDDAESGGAAASVTDSSSSTVTTVTAPGSFIYTCDGHPVFTVYFSAYTSGSAIITLTPTASTASGAGGASSVTVSNLGTDTTAAVAPAGATGLRGWASALYNSFGASTDVPVTSPSTQASFMSYVRGALVNWAGLFALLPSGLNNNRLLVDAVPSAYGTATLTAVSGGEGVSYLTISGSQALMLSMLVDVTTGTSVGAVLSFTGSRDGGINFPDSLGLQQFGTGSTSTSVTSVTTAGGNQRLEMTSSNYTHIRVTLTSLSSGNVVITWLTGVVPKLVKVPSIGDIADTAASTDTGSFSLVSLFKRLLQKTPALGAAVSSAAVPVTMSSDSFVPYKTIAGLTGSTAFTGALTTSQNNILDSTGTGGWSDFRGFSSINVSISTSSTTTAGTIVFETSPDGSSNITVLYSAVMDTGATLPTTNGTQALTASLNKMYALQGNLGYIRARVSVNFANSSGAATACLTAIGYGSNFQYPITQTANLTYIGGSAISSTTAIKSGQKALGVGLTSHLLLVDRAAAVMNSTTTSSMITDDYGVSASFVITVTATGGTNPTLDLVMQVTADDGTSYRDAYHMERITVNGTYYIPEMAIDGRRRWSWTVGGSASPTFTVAITSTRSPRSARLIRNFYDRTLILTGTSTPTAGYFIGGCSNVTGIVSAGAGGTTAAIVLQLSTNNVDWYNASSPVTIVASTINVVSNTQGIVGNWARIKCSTLDAAATVTYAAIHAN